MKCPCGCKATPIPSPQPSPLFFDGEPFCISLLLPDLGFAWVFLILQSQEPHPGLEAVADSKAKVPSSPSQEKPSEPRSHRVPGHSKIHTELRAREPRSWSGKCVLAQAQPVPLGHGSSLLAFPAMNCFTATQEAKAAKAELESACPTPAIRRGGRPCQELF